MSESKSDAAISTSDRDAKAPNGFERLKEEIETIVHTEKSHRHRHRHHHHHKETHGKNDDIDENTPIDNVKAPNVFERAKEEIEALVQTIHHKEESQTHKTRDQSTKAGSGSEKTDNDANSPNVMQSAKEETERITRGENSPHHHHHHETHGRSNDIDESTPINEVRGPNIFERAKEEIEALVYAIHPKKESSNSVSSLKKDGGFRQSIGRGLEKVCSPFSHKKD